MAFPKKHLYNDEVIVLDRYPHWWYLFPRAVLLVVACALGIWALVFDFDTDSKLEGPVQIVAAALVLAALVAFVIRLIGWRSTNFVVTTERCIYRSGVLHKTGIEIPLDRINTVFFSQTLFERILKAGDLAIESAGENSRQSFSDITNPVEVQNTIYKQMEENENRKYDRIGSEARQAAAQIQAQPQNLAQPTQVITVAEQLEKLAELRDRGVITPAEFEAQKAQLLGG
ncbi:MAG TPA: PH domain-containing protein [Microthrixaceae bacterium]|nr:PH domain-containing protein [Microthrixaceae bacterium]HNI34602.1 PH domain-containing protein [Microthrixaceae bacterium]